MQNAKQPFEQENSIKPPKRLFYRVIERLKIEKNLYLTRKHLSFSYVLLAALLIIVPFILVGFARELSESEFSPIISLFFSDMTAITSNWRDFSLSLLESVPAVFITIILGVVLLAMILLKLAANYLDKISSLIKLINKKHV